MFLKIGKLVDFSAKTERTLKLRGSNVGKFDSKSLLPI